MATQQTMILEGQPMGETMATLVRNAEEMRTLGWKICPYADRCEGAKNIKRFNNYCNNPEFFRRSGEQCARQYANENGGGRQR
jgi:hypothetical protein